MKKLFSAILATLSAAAVVCAAGCGNDKPRGLNPDPIDDNYRVFYQIFVGSFSDSDGDGTGDIRGIINRMDYLNDGDVNSGNDLGVQGIWLSPIFTSPSYHKYDAIDYYSIDPKFGTKEDLQELISLCHERNVKVILDLAINHNSSQSEWFAKFKQARKDGNTSDPYYDFYSCVKSSDRLSGHTYYPLRAAGLYYEGNFSADMPELNFDNTAVREETVKIAKHYLDMGIDGFRFDAIKYIYYGDNAKSAEFWEWYMSELKKIKPDIYTVGECWSGDSEVIEYYGALNCFNFTTYGPEGQIAKAARSSNTNLEAFTKYIGNYQAMILQKNEEAMYMPFLANHDTDRAAGFATVSSGDAYMAANLYILCCGSPTIYYGEEIGMKGTRGGANTDANRRLAMLWGDKDKVQDPEGTTFEKSNQINGTVSEQLKASDSLLLHYKKVIEVRNKYPELARGIYSQLGVSKSGGEILISPSADIKLSSDVGGFKITYDGKTTYLLHNVSYETKEIQLPDYITELCDFVGLNGATLSGRTLTLQGQTSVILK